MSLYTWLNTHSTEYSHPPYDKDKYLRYPHELDLSNPQCGLGWRHAYEGPTVVNINVQETYDVTQIKDYVLQLLDEKTEGLAENITEAAIQKMQNDINLTVDQAIQQAFVEMTREAIDQAFETE